MTDNAIVRISELKKELVKTKDLKSVSVLKDKAEAVRRLAARQGASWEILFDISQFKLEAERYAGALLAGMELNKGGKSEQGSYRSQRATGKKTAPTLAEMGVKTKSDSSRWQREATVPEERFVEWLEGIRKKKGEPTSSGLIQLAKQIAVEKIKEEAEQEERTTKAGVVDNLEKVVGTFKCIYCDPPWAYGDKTGRGSAHLNYPTMPIEDICSLPVGQIAFKKGAHLWMWTTWPKIRDYAPQEVLDAWGFEWKGEIIWNKMIIGPGRWLRNQTEVLIFATKGKLDRMRNDLPGYFEKQREQKHSRKPVEMYEIIESFSPGPRIELFAREERKGWKRWGFEA